MSFTKLFRITLLASLLTAPLMVSADQVPGFVRDGEDNQFFQSRAEGLSVVVKEITALKQLIQIVQSLPDERGRYRVSFDRMLTDLDLIQKGVLETINLPTTAPVQGIQEYPALTADYME